MDNQIIPHLGKILRQLLRERNLSAKKFASMIGYDFRGVYHMFKRRNFDTDLLYLISQALNHDMFQYCSQHSQTSSEEKQKILSLQTETEKLKKEIEFLKEIIQSLKKK